MTAALLVALSLVGQPQVHRMPALSGSYDAVVVMTEDAMLPASAWEGLTPGWVERLWSWGCRGMMVQGVAWSGYVVLCPSGTGETLLEPALALASAPVSGEPSGWETALRLEPVGCGPAVLLFSGDSSSAPPDSLPLRTSIFLGSGPDTLMMHVQAEGSAFFWTLGSNASPLSRAAWRGLRTSVVPAGEGSVALARSGALGGVPSNLASLDPGVHPWDTVYAATWGTVLSAVDTLVARLHPLSEEEGHLLWLRGSGSGDGLSMRHAPAPNPPFSPAAEVDAPEGWTGEPMPDAGDLSGLPGAVPVQLPGSAGDAELIPLLASVLNRMVGSVVLPELPCDALFEVHGTGDGRLVLVLVPLEEAAPEDDIAGAALEALEEAVLVPPGETLIGNASVRTAILTGTGSDPPAPHRIGMALHMLMSPTGE